MNSKKKENLKFYCISSARKNKHFVTSELRDLSQNFVHYIILSQHFAYFLILFQQPTELFDYLEPRPWHMKAYVWSIQQQLFAKYSLINFRAGLLNLGARAKKNLGPSIIFLQCYPHVFLYLILCFVIFR